MAFYVLNKITELRDVLTYFKVIVSQLEID